MKKVIALVLFGVAMFAAILWQAQKPPNTESANGPAAETAEQAEAILRTRAKQRWDAIIRNDFAAAYAFETPSYRAVNDLTTFMTRFAGQVSRENVNIARVEFEDPSLAKVTIELEFKAAVFGTIIDSVSYDVETWARIDGQWWHLPKN